MAEKDTDIGVHLSWVYSPIFDSKISDSILSITTIDGEKEFTNIQLFYYASGNFNFRYN